MAAGKEKSQGSKKKSVSFVNIEGLSKQVPLHNADGGLLLHVKGNGKLCIRSSSLDGDSKVDIDIHLNIENQTKPVTLLLPQEQSASKLEINGDGDMQFSIKDTAESRDNKYSSQDELNDLNGKTFVDGGNKHKKTHRRNNSDFLEITGKDLNILDSDEDLDEEIETKDCGTDVCSIDILLAGDSLGNSALSTGCFSCGNSEIRCDMCKKKVALECADKTEDTIVNGSNIQSLVDTVLRFGKLDPTSSDLLPSETFPKSFDVDWGRSNVSCLKDSIRKSYTYLLDVLDLLDLCDHLYENSVLEIDIYQKLFDMCYEPRFIRSAKRSLLMYLSTRSVRQDKMINALYGSAQYQLIPYFYPGARI